MKKLVYLFVSLFLIVVAAGNVSAQNEATGTANATALIIQPIEIETNTDLQFGTLVPSGTDGTVTISPAGERSEIDVDVIGQQGGFSAASFTVTGEQSYTFSLSLPSGESSTDAIVNLTDGDSNTMPVYNFVSSFGENTNGIEIASGGTSFSVGATLGVDAEQDAGNYTGTFDVIVAYE